MVKAGKLLVLAVFILILFTGCAPSINISEVKPYADPATENLLIAMNDNNFTEFVKGMDDDMKNALSKANFNELISKVNGVVGNYIPNSKKLYQAVNNDEYVTAIYLTKFTNESSEVTVKVVFKDVDGVMKITGLWFDSTKLRGET
jgi:hypothetical protein